MNVDLFVRPHDVLFVGPPWSNVAGETHRVHSLFPPPPTTFQGAVRTHLLRRAGVPLGDKAAIREAVGTSDALPVGASIEGPWVATVEDDGRRGALEVWLPVPRWCVQVDRHVVPRTVWARQAWRDTVAASEPLEPLAPVAEGERAEGWVRAAALGRLLRGEEVGPSALRPLPAGITLERRPGLELDARRLSVEGMLYVKEGYRFPREAGLAATVRWPSLGVSEGQVAGGAMTLGAKGRLATVAPRPRWTETTRALWRGEAAPGAGGERGGPDGGVTRAWVYLASPVALDDPRAPGLLGRAGGGRPGEEVRVRVVAAALGRPLMLGGFRMVERSPRPLRPFVPAGSGWRVELRGGDARAREEVLRGWHGRAVLGPAEERKMGCGIVLVGAREVAGGGVTR